MMAIRKVTRKVKWHLVRCDVKISIHTLQPDETTIKIYKRFKEREEIYETTRKFVQDTGITWTTMFFCRLFFSIRSACRLVSPNALAMAVWASGADTAFSFKGWAHGHWHNWNCYIILVTSCEERLRMC
jgi:hypothetical protein